MKIISNPRTSLTLAVVLLSAGIFAGCTSNNLMKNETAPSEETTQTMTEEEKNMAMEKMEQSVSSSDDLESIETELDSTIILDEDFSDLQ